MEKIETATGLPGSEVAQKQTSQQDPTLKDLFTRLRTSEQGLSSTEAQRRLNEAGLNEPSNEQKRSALLQFLRLFTNPLVAILLAASAISVLLGDVVNASVIVTIVLLNALLNFVQTYRSQQAIE